MTDCMNDTLKQNNGEVLVSVITVCRNSEKTIRKTVESVLGQTYGNVDYIIVDGLSTDGTLDIIEEYRENHSICLISEKDSGIYEAMNKGIRRAKGELIALLNSDDTYELDSVENMVRTYLENGKKGSIYYGMMRMLEEGRESQILFFHHNFIRSHMINHPTCFITRRFYEEFGLYDENYISAADYDFMLRVDAKYKGRLDEIFVPVYKVITNFSSGGMSESERGYFEGITLLHKYNLIPEKKYRWYCFKRRLKLLINWK